MRRGARRGDDARPTDPSIFGGSSPSDRGDCCYAICQGVSDIALQTKHIRSAFNAYLTEVPRRPDPRAATGALAGISSRHAA
jgi:hypothetical protein